MGCSLSSPRFWGSDGGSFWNLGSLEGSTQAVGSPVVWSWAAKLSPDHWDPGSATVFKIWPPSGFWGLPWWLSGLKKKKNPPASAGDSRDVSSIPGLGSSLKEEMATHSSVLAWEIPRTEEPGGLQCFGLQKELDMS